MGTRKTRTRERGAAHWEPFYHLTLGDAKSPDLIDQLLAQAPPAAVYYDPQSVSREGVVVTVRVRFALDLVQLLKLDSRARAVSVFAQSKGRLIAEAREWRALAPGSYQEAIWNRLCSS